MKFFIGLVFNAVFLFPQLHAQPRRLTFEQLSIEQGLSQSIVYCILQDQKGFLWFGTEDGLNKYDGYNFTILRHDPHQPNSLSYNEIRARSRRRMKASGGVTLSSTYFDLIKNAGFTSVRIPIRWSAHATANAPYTIASSFLQRVDWAVDQALTRKLAVVINIHHYEEIMINPSAHKARFLAIWQQLAAHYKNYSGDLFFELLNEHYWEFIAGFGVYNGAANDWNYPLLNALIPKTSSALTMVSVFRRPQTDQQVSSGERRSAVLDQQFISIIPSKLLRRRRFL